MFDIAKFKKNFSQFNHIDDDIILDNVEVAKCYIDQSSKCYNQLLNLVVAHMLYLKEQQANGNNNTSSIASATIDKVSISYQAPVSNSSTSQWFNLSPYGLEFLVLNKRCNGTPRYYGGSLNKISIR